MLKSTRQSLLALNGTRNFSSGSRTGQKTSSLSSLPTSKSEKLPNFEKIVKPYFQFSKADNDCFTSTSLTTTRHNHPSAAYGGLIFAQAIAAAEQTVDSSLRPHSAHSYFILGVHPKHPVTYKVRRVRDGKSFATRTVDAVQKGKVAFVLQTSFHVEEKESLLHQCEMPDVPPPDSLMNMKDAIEYTKEKIAKNEQTITTPEMLNRLKNYDSQVYTGKGDLFEVRPTNLADYYGFSGHKKPELNYWIRARGDLKAEDTKLHRWLLAYISDAKMYPTASSAHYLNNFSPSFMFTLSHGIHFHKSDIKADDWLLLETKSRIASGSRVSIDGQIWKQNGELLASCHQEALVRTKGKPSILQA